MEMKSDVWSETRVFYMVCSQRDGLVSPMVILAAVCCGFLSIVVLGGFLYRDEQAMIAQAGSDKEHAYQVEVSATLPKHAPAIEWEYPSSSPAPRSAWEEGMRL